jgi:hypothetical protein
MTSWEWWPSKQETRERSTAIAGRCVRNENLTLREAAALSGQIVFAMMLSPQGLHSCQHAPDLLSAARCIGQEAFGQRNTQPGVSGWDQESSTREWRQALSRAWDWAVALPAAPWMEQFTEMMRVRVPDRQFVLSTDASKRSLGWCMGVRHTGQFRWVTEGPHMCGGRVLTDEERMSHIYLLELKAALEALHQWKWSHSVPGEAPSVSLVVENAAAAFTLKHGFSNNTRANALLERFRDCLDLIDEVILVISEDNPSDCCSRNLRSDWVRPCGNVHEHTSYAGRWRQLEKCLESRCRGWNWASMKHEVWLAKERSRNDAHDLRSVPPSDDGTCLFAKVEEDRTADLS